MPPPFPFPQIFCLIKRWEEFPNGLLSTSMTRNEPYLMRNQYSYEIGIDDQDNRNIGWRGF